MGRFKDIFNGEHKRFAYFVTGTTALFVALWLVGPGTTVIHWVRAKIEISRQEKMIREYLEENEILQKRYDMLCNQRDTLEKFAREQFHFAAPGDDVYLFETE